MQNTNTTNPQTFLWTGLEIDSSSIFTRTFNLLRTERCNSLINQGNGLQKTSTQLGCRNREAFRHFGWNVKNWGLPLSCPGVTSTAPQSAQGFSVLFAALLLVTHKLQAAVQKLWTFFPKPAILQNPAYIYRRSQKRSTAVEAPIPRRRAAPAAQRFRPEPLRSRTHSVSRLRLTAGKFSTSQRVSGKVTRASGRARTAAPWGAPNNRPRCAEAIRPRGVVPGLVRALRAAPGAETLPEAAGAAPAEGGRPWGNGSALVTRWTPPGGRPTAPGSGRNPRGPAAPQAVTPPPPTRCRSGLSKRPAERLQARSRRVLPFIGPIGGLAAGPRPTIARTRQRARSKKRTPPEGTQEPPRSEQTTPGYPWPAAHLSSQPWPRACTHTSRLNRSSAAILRFEFGARLPQRRGLEMAPGNARGVRREGNGGAGGGRRRLGLRGWPAAGAVRLLRAEEEALLQDGPGARETLLRGARAAGGTACRGEGRGSPGTRVPHGRTAGSALRRRRRQLRVWDLLERSVPALFLQTPLNRWFAILRCSSAASVPQEHWMHADLLFKTFLTRKKMTGKEFRALLIRNSKYMQNIYIYF